ncbi:MAG TPA: magnesium/cobalt transporter CorA [Acidimicrobiales bacterium]|nr:magnesium/cobalt transporter CorA [Acidimicrobiales bacterium]
MLKGTLRRDGRDEAATPENVVDALAGTGFFWLDLDDAAVDGTVAELLSVHFAFHPLAVQAAERFGQRPRIDDYSDFIYLVARGADPERKGKAEVHCFWTDRYVVTVHRGDCPALTHVHERLERHPVSQVASPQIVIVYLVIGALVDSFFPYLSDFDDRIDTLEDDILKAPTEAQLGELFDMKRALMEMRKVIAPQRDMMASINAGVTDVPGMTDEATRYFRDLYDHLIRLADLVDSYRDLLSSVMDTHLSTVSNRLNVVMKQLTIIATIFLPLSFLTGFFGQNFAYLVRVWLSPTWSFYVLGIGLELATVIGLVVLFRKRGWLGGPTV